MAIPIPAPQVDVIIGIIVILIFIAIAFLVRYLKKLREPPKPEFLRTDPTSLKSGCCIVF